MSEHSSSTGEHRQEAETITLTGVTHWCNWPPVALGGIWSSWHMDLNSAALLRALLFLIFLFCLICPIP